MINRYVFTIILFALIVHISSCRVNPRIDDTPLPLPQNGDIYVVAHRGAHNGIPENTLAAYQKAIELGADFVEIDLRTTKDNQLVSVHNKEIDVYVSDGKTGLVSDFTLLELKQLDIGSRIGPEWKAERIPTFEEILTLCKDKIGIYLDLKNADVSKTVEIIKKYKMEKSILWYADYNELKQVEQLCQDCIIMPDPGPEDGLSELFNHFDPAVVASVWRHYSKSFVETCHKEGTIVIVDESDSTCWQQAIDWGSDGIQTDHPEELISFLKSSK